MLDPNSHPETAIPFPARALTDTTVLVTGASRGIGRAIALGMAAAGSDVVGLARSPDLLDTLGDEVQSHGVDYLAVECDVAQASQFGETVEVAWHWKGRIDVLVNAAGVMIRREPPDVTTEDWDLLFAVNTRAPFMMTQEVGKRMLAGDGGSIINITSLAGEVVTGASLIYQASKASLIHLTRGLAVRWGPAVRVNAVGPGYIRTDMSADFLAEEEQQQYVLDHTPLGRIGEPEDVVGAVVFLASPDASFITGQHLRVDGGWS